ncbi:MAG: ABC transporter permease [Oscillospiraceae bacterium]
MREPETYACSPKHGPLRNIWRRLCQRRLAVFGMAVLALLVLLAIFADVIAPYPYDLQNYSATFQFPSWKHPFGTDNFGRDILSRVIYGTRISLQIGVISLTGGAVLGCMLGAVAGYFGGVLDTVIMRLTDILMSIPKTVLAIAIATTLGPGLTNAMIAISISSIPNFARVVRASTLTVRNQEYVEAAIAIGASHSRIIFRYILPNVMAPIIVQATLGVGTAIILAASLSFLGLGIQPPAPEWGSMLSSARGFIRDQWYMVLFPGLAIMLTVLALNLFGDGLRDALDPKLKN